MSVKYSGRVLHAGAVRDLDWDDERPAVLVRHLSAVFIEDGVHGLAVAGEHRVAVPVDVALAQRLAVGPLDRLAVGVDEDLRAPRHPPARVLVGWGYRQLQSGATRPIAVCMPGWGQSKRAPGDRSAVGRPP